MNDCKEQECEGNKCLTDNPPEIHPEFIVLLSELKSQLALMDETSNIIFDRINFIKDVREPNEEVMQSKEPRGLLDELWICVDRMKLYNCNLIKSKKALIRFLG